MPIKVAILTRFGDRSPKVLAESLSAMCTEAGFEAEIFYEGAAMLARIFPLQKKILYKIHFHFRLRNKIKYLLQDTRLASKLKQFDVIIFSECIPNAYWRGYYGIEELRKKINKPICLYEVYYLGNSLTHSRELQNSGHHTIERYDWNFSISDTTEIKSVPSSKAKWSVIGLNVSSFKLGPVEKEFIVLIDFAQPGFERERELQLETLSELGIKPILLEGNYTVSEIRDLYRKAAILFVQFPEAFGLPMAESLSTGTHIFLPDIYWAMSWRKIDQEGNFFLPPCFSVYDDKDDLKRKICKMREEFHSINTPACNFSVFTHNYEHFYQGDATVLKNSIDQILIKNKC